jgi:hypothetical protein
MAILRIHIACCITKATHTPSEYVIHTVFHGNNGYAKGPQYYVYTYTARFSFLLWNIHTVPATQLISYATRTAKSFFRRSSDWGAMLIPHLHLVTSELHRHPPTCLHDFQTGNCLLRHHTDVGGGRRLEDTAGHNSTFFIAENLQRLSYSFNDALPTS